jgi:SAM-dependent methyltransferase
VKSLLIGCGTNKARRISLDPAQKDWDILTTLDIDPDTGCDFVHDLEELPYPFDTHEFDEVHAYEVLEHTGRQGDWRFFFGQFAELYRIIRPGGHLYITVPSVKSRWLWGDPGHTRALPREAFSWLDQTHYHQVGKTACTDYRPYWKGHFTMLTSKDDGEIFLAILERGHQP